MNARDLPVPAQDLRDSLAWAVSSRHATNDVEASSRGSLGGSAVLRAASRIRGRLLQVGWLAVTIVSSTWGQLTKRRASASGPSPILELRDRRRSVDAIVVPLAMLLISAWLFWFSYRNAPVVAVWDGWTWIGHAKAYSEGGLSRLFAEHPFIHAQHFYFLPSMVALVLGPLVDYSFRPFAFLCVGLLVAIGLVSYRFARNQGLGRYAALAVFASVASMRHYENLLLGFQIGLLACVLFGSLAVIVADARRDRRGLVLAIVLATAAVASSSAGVFAWVALVLVRWCDPTRMRRWGVAGLVVLVIAPVVHFTLKATYGPSFVEDFLGSVSSSTVPVMFEHSLKVIGGALVGGRSAVPVGLALLAGSCAMIVIQVRRTGRFDAMTGLVILSLLTSVTIAVARLPFESPDSRHAVFALPAVVVCGIGLLRFLREQPSVRVAGYSSIVVGLLWVDLDGRLDASGWQGALEPLILDARFATAMSARQVPLSAQEIAAVNPGPTETIRGLIEFARDQGWMGIRADSPDVEIRRALPTKVQGATLVTVEAGVLAFSGRGHVYDEFVCSEPDGQDVQVMVDAITNGATNVGIIVRHSDGSPPANICSQMIPGEGMSHASARARVALGDRVNPYLYADSPDVRVRLSTFTVVVLKSSPRP